MTVHPRWPHAELDVPALRAAGHRPHPFRQYVVKIHSRCNLACDYCYVYEMADHGYQRQPPTMSPGTVRATVARIAEHVRAHEIRAIRVTLHGGEPLLAGTALIEDFAGRLRRALPAGTEAELTVQTNGTRLDERTLGVLLRVGVRVGLSVDGSRLAVDRHRRYPSGRSSHPAVQAAIARLRSEPYRAVYGGLLCTISLENDPVETYQALLADQPPGSTSCCRTEPGRTRHRSAGRTPPRLTPTGCWPCSGGGRRRHGRRLRSCCLRRSSRAAWVSRAGPRRSDSGRPTRS